MANTTGAADSGASPDLDAGEIGEIDEIEEAEIDEGDAGEADEAGQGGEAEGDEEEVDDVAARPQRGAARPRGRNERRAAEIRELRERNERLERDVEAIRSQQGRAPVDPAAAQRAEEQWWEQAAVLPQDQFVRAVRDRERQVLGGALAQQEQRIADRIDKSTWDSSARSDPMRAKFSQRVEREVETARAQGRSPDRETIYTYLVGQEVLRQRGLKLATQQNGGRRRVAAQRTTPAGGRSDSVRERAPAGDSYEAARKRLDNQPLW
jgi:hypothetical protein